MAKKPSDDDELELVELTDEELAGDDVGALGLDADEEPPAREPEAPKAAALHDAAPFADPDRKPKAPCPHCGKPVVVTKHRCPACGRSLRDLVDDETARSHEAFRARSRMLALGAAAVAALVLIYMVGSTLMAVDARLSARAERSEATVESLVKLYGPKSPLGPEQRTRQWQRYQGKYVRWSGRVHEQRPGGLFDPVAVVFEAKGARIEVYMHPDEAKKAPVGSSVTYEATLAAQEEGPTFVLRGGVIIDP